jgi:hypothetical protein
MTMASSPTDTHTPAANPEWGCLYMFLVRYHRRDGQDKLIASTVPRGRSASTRLRPRWPYRLSLPCYEAEHTAPGRSYHTALCVLEETV